MYVDFNMTSFDACDFGNKVMKQALGGLSDKTRKLAHQVCIQLMRNFRFRATQPRLANTKLVIIADVVDIEDDGEDDVDQVALHNYLNRKNIKYFNTLERARDFGFGVHVNESVKNDLLDIDNMRFPELEEVDDNNADEFNQVLNILMSRARHELDEDDDDALTKPVQEFGRSRLKMLSKIKPTIASTKAEEITEESMCSICLEKMSAVDDSKTLHCKHMFHTKCIFNWLNKRNCCPYCRSCSLALIDL